MPTQGQTRSGGGATPAQKAALEKARAMRSQKAQTGVTGGGNVGFENPQQLGQQAGELWLKGFNNVIQTGLKQALGSFKTQPTSTSSTGMRGGSRAQHAKAGRKGGEATAASTQTATG